MSKAQNQALKEQKFNLSARSHKNMDLVNQEHEDSFERLNIKDQNIVDEANGLMPPSDREINLEENKKSSDGAVDANSVHEPGQKGSHVVQVM